MNGSELKWDRKELYEKVWAHPLRTLAADYGISDVALAKVCRKLKIPLPGLGHWAKIQSGQTIPQPPLPVVKELPVLRRTVSKQKTSPLAEDLPKLTEIQRIEGSPAPLITSAMLVHRLIKNAKRVLGSARTIDRGVLKPDRGVECLDLRVSKDCLPRALGVMASMLQILEKEGFSVVVEKRDKESTSAMIYGEEIRFGVVERSRQIKPSPTQDAKTANTTSYAYNPIRLEPTGLLSIEVWNFYSGSPQKTWRDRESATLEEQLPTCVAGMLKIALWSRAERNAREREAEAKQKKVDEVTEVLDRIEEEEKRIKALKREAIAWSRAERIRNYIAAVRAEAAKNSDSSERTKLLEWTDWAEQQADRADPLKKSPASIIDEKDEVLRRLHSVRWGW